MSHVAKPVQSTDDGQNEALPKSPEVSALLRDVEALLQKDEPKQALSLLSRAKNESLWLRNAVGVCQLRLGNAQFAVDIFRGLAINDKAFGFRQDVPTVFKTNFATAMLLSENLDGCLNVLGELRNSQHPAVDKLRGAIEKWKSGFSLFQKIMWWFGSQPTRPVFLDYPPGDLS